MEIVVESNLFNNICKKLINCLPVLLHPLLKTLQRISYNTRYFSGNYGVVIAILAVYAL